MMKPDLVRIDQVWMAVAVGADGMEGVCAVKIDGSWMPLLAADEDRLPWLTNMARQLATERQCLVRIVRLHGREEVEQFDGRQ